MKIAQFQDHLDIHGPDVASWPDGPREAALRLVAADSMASAALRRAEAVETLIRHEMAPSRVSSSVLKGAAARVAGVLNGPLPAQRRAWRWWPAELAGFDFAPAWPRVAALAGVAALGFGVGLVALGGNFAGSLAVIQAANADVDASAIVLDPESITGLRP